MGLHVCIYNTGSLRDIATPYLHKNLGFADPVYVCMHVCAYNINVCACACVRARACACVSVHMCLFAYVYMCVFGLCIICIFGGVYMRGSVCVHIQDLLDCIACMMVVKSILPHAIIWRFQLLVADDDLRLIIGWLLQIHSVICQCNVIQDRSACKQLSPCLSCAAS